MINKEHPSDLASFRHTDFGYFAPVPVLAEPTPPATACERPVRGGEARESTTPKGSRRDERNTDSRGGRIQFKKGRGGGRW